MNKRFYLMLSVPACTNDDSIENAIAQGKMGLV